MGGSDPWDLDFKLGGRTIELTLFWLDNIPFDAPFDGMNHILGSAGLLATHGIRLDWFPRVRQDPFIIRVPDQSPINIDSFKWTLRSYADLVLKDPYSILKNILGPKRILVFFGQTLGVASGEAPHAAGWSRFCIVDPLGKDTTVLAHELGHVADLHHLGQGDPYKSEQKKKDAENFADRHSHNLMYDGPPRGLLWRWQVQKFANICAN